MDDKTSSPLLVTSQYSPISFFIGCVLSILYAISTTLSLVEATGVTSNILIIGTLISFFSILGSTFMLIIWWFKRISDESCDLNSPMRIKVVHVLENTYFILIMLSISIRVVMEILVGQCEVKSLSLQSGEYCNSFQDEKLIQPMYMTSLMLYPLLAYVLIRETRPIFIGVAWMISIGTLIWCTAYLNSLYLVLPTFAYFFASLLIFYDTKRQNDDMLRLVRALQITAAENERLQDEARATELRAMIGNVAHDLKTPLTSILSGIECIDDIVGHISNTVVTESTGSSSQEQGHVKVCGTIAAVTEHLKGIRACILSMKGANSFMTMCINRCIDYTKASKGVKLVPKLETVQLREALEFPVSIMRDIQSQLPIVLHPIPSSIIAHVITDKQWLMENVLCLLSNAARYSHSGHIDLKLSLVKPASDAEKSRSRRDIGKPKDVMIRVEVLDSGIGLSDAAMQGLFTPFKQAQRLAGGTGLGLFSLARRVEALQGKFGVSRRPDGAQGSLFWFSIPYRPDITAGKMSPMSSLRFGEMPDRHTERVHFCRSRSASDRKILEVQHMRVLVVDDAPTVLKMTSMLLSKKGHTVEQAVNGAAAVEKVLHRAAEHRRLTPPDSPDLIDNLTSLEEGGQEKEITGFDVVLMDLQMPVMDGVEAIRRIRAVEQKANQELKLESVPERERELESVEWARGGTQQPLQRGGSYGRVGRNCQFIVALSANSDSETAQEALKAGANDFIPKPFSYDTFLEVMRRHDLMV